MHLIIVEKDELKELIIQSIAECLDVYTPPQPVESQPVQLIYGIRGLAKFLNCCYKTAVRIKDSGRIPYTRFNNIIIFKSSDVLNYKNNDIIQKI